MLDSEEWGQLADCVTIDAAFVGHLVRAGAAEGVPGALVSIRSQICLRGNAAFNRVFKERARVCLAVFQGVQGCEMVRMTALRMDLELHDDVHELRIFGLQGLDLFLGVSLVIQVGIMLHFEFFLK